MGERSRLDDKETSTRRPAAGVVTKLNFTSSEHGVDWLIPVVAVTAEILTPCAAKALRHR